MADWITLAMTTISSVVVAVLAACLGYCFQQRRLKHERERINRDFEIKRAQDFYKELSELMEKLYFQMKYKMLKQEKQKDGTKAYFKETVKEGEPELDVEAFEQAKANWWARQIYNHMMVKAVFGKGKHGVDIQQKFLEVHKMFKNFSQRIKTCKPEENFRGEMQRLRLYIRKCNLMMMDAIQREDVGGGIPNKKMVAKDIVEIQADIDKEDVGKEIPNDKTVAEDIAVSQADIVKEDVGKEIPNGKTVAKDIVEIQADIDKEPEESA